MKYNKGFAPLILLAIIVGALVVGGGAVYFATKTPTSPKNATRDNYYPPIGQNQNSLTNTTDTTTKITTSTQNKQVECNSSSSPSVTVISPNGGEIYAYEQKINIKWDSCNIKNNDMASGLKNIDDGKEYHLWAGKLVNSDEQNIGSASEMAVIPGNYKAFICNTKRDSNLKPTVAYTNLENFCSILDYSDVSFKIQGPVQSQIPFTWKNYQGENFEIKYPSDWKVSFAPEGSVTYFIFMSTMGRVTFDIEPYEGDINYYLNDLIKEPSFTQKDIVIGGIPAKKISFVSSASNAKYTYYQIAKGGIGFRLTESLGYLKDTTEINKINKIFEEMAFSFKFK